MLLLIHRRRNSRDADNTPTRPRPRGCTPPCTPALLRHPHPPRPSPPVNKESTESLWTEHLRTPWTLTSSEYVSQRHSSDTHCNTVTLSPHRDSSFTGTSLLLCVRLTRSSLYYACRLFNALTRCTLVVLGKG